MSISIAIRFSSRFFRSINNLILASTEIGQGNLINFDIREFFKGIYPPDDAKMYFMCNGIYNIKSIGIGEGKDLSENIDIILF